jgi:hypothetical protein
MILRKSVHLTACAFAISAYLDSLVLSSAALSCTRQHEKEIKGRISYWCDEKHFYLFKKSALNTTTPKTNSFPTWSDTPADIT